MSILPNSSTMYTCLVLRSAFAIPADNRVKLQVARAYHRRCKLSLDASERRNGVKRVGYLWAWEDAPRRRELRFGGVVREERAKRGRAPELWTLVLA
jgi:hypothetical protein